MKKIKFCLFAFMAMFYLQSCGNSEIITYSDDAGVYFKDLKSVYTFLGKAEKVEIGYDTVKVFVVMTGRIENYDREFEVVLRPDDSLQTISSDMITVNKGVVKAGEYSGYIPVQVNYSAALDDSIYVARMNLIPTKDFPITDLNYTVHTISITNMFTEPENWELSLKPVFGPYSNYWYKWILETTGRESLPYKAGTLTDEEKLIWTMTAVERNAVAAQVKEALTIYNSKNPDNVLKHEDGLGDLKGQPVVMP